MAADYDARLDDAIRRGEKLIVRVSNRLAGWDAREMTATLQFAQYSTAIMNLPGDHPAPDGFVEVGDGESWVIHLRRGGHEGILGYSYKIRGPASISVHSLVSDPNEKSRRNYLFLVNTYVSTILSKFSPARVSLLPPLTRAKRKTIALAPNLIPNPLYS